ncbi:Phage DNA transfer protein [Salmonella enterica subsp. enterica]|uniref:Phage DNA transfer protein n=1 Tax=Salmonella enterica I TaxID=59201 RepID=A0A379V335_SALET|nr:Phage DNA transfer protein [Salmonella enterica subsp. enterica]
MSRVDRSWAKFNDMMSNTRVQKAIQSGKTTPEDVTKLVFSQSPAERAQLYRLLDDSGRQNARAALVQRAMDKATSDSGKLSVEKFINEMKRNRKQAETFFRGEHGKQLDGIMKYLDSTRQAATAARKPTNRANGSWSSGADNSSCVCYKPNVCKSCGSWRWYRYGWQGL